jgi:hypothetical protein
MNIYSLANLQTQVNNITASGVGGSVTLSGTGGVKTSISGGVWYVDGGSVAGTGSGSTSVSGVTINGTVLQILMLSQLYNLG